MLFKLGTVRAVATTLQAEPDEPEEGDVRGLCCASRLTLHQVVDEELAVPVVSQNMAIDALWAVLSFIGILVIGLVLVFPAWPTLKLALYVMHKYGSHQGYAFVPIAYILYGLAISAEMVALKWLLIGRYRAGTWSTRGWFYLRWWFVDRLLDFVCPIFVDLFRGTRSWRWPMGSK